MASILNGKRQILHPIGAGQFLATKIINLHLTEMKSKLITSAFLFLFSLNCFSQSWIKEMQKPEPNFFSIKKKADSYFKDEIRKLNYQNKHAKLNAKIADDDEGVEGYGIYKRWETFWQPRVNADGSFPDPDAVYYNMQAWRQKNAQNTLHTQGTWQPLGPFNTVTGNNQGAGVGRINGMAVNPLNENEIYACAPTGGIWKSPSGGNNFSTTTDELAAIGFTSIVVDYTDPNIIYAGSGEGDGQILVSYSLGVLKSTDGGLTYHSTGLDWKKKNVRQTQKIVMDPLDHNVLIVTTNIGIFRTTDAGANWVLAKPGQTRDIEFQPGNNNVVYATSDKAMYRSTDNGITWATITAGLPDPNSINRLSLAVTPANPNYVYAIAGDGSTSGFYGMYRSEDAGLTFSLRANQPNLLSGDTDGADIGGFSWYTLAIAVDPTDADHVFTGGINVWESFDGGINYILNAHWYENNYNYVHADIHFLDFIGNTLFCGSDGGLWKSTDFGFSWIDLSGGMQISQFYRLAGSEINNSLVYTGSQDNGSFRYNGSWKKVYGGDGMEQAISPINTNIVFSESQNNGLSRSTNGGNSYVEITNGLTGVADWNTPFLLNASGVLYVGRQDIFKSVNNGSSYTKVTDGGLGVLKYMAICKTAQNVMYGTDGGSVYKINLANGNVANISSGLPGPISHVAVSDNDSNKVYVTISGFSTNKVFRSIDGGLNWANISGNLPNIPAVSIAVQNDSLEGIYLGTDAGVFYRNNNFTNWQSFMNGLPNVVIDELEINYNAGKIRAATYGRGLWESDLYVTSPPIADFTEDRTMICPGQTVTFTDVSSEGPTSNTWTFPGGTPSSATGSIVTVTYPTAGVYDASLTAGNAAGTNSTTKTQHINVTYNQQSLPLVEGFETGTIPAGWEVLNPDNDLSAWQLANVGGYDASAHSYVSQNFDAADKGVFTILLTQNYDLTTLSNLNLVFDVAYAKKSVTLNDSLRVEISTDCGDSWTTIYKKGGNALRTTNTFYPNSRFVPLASHWRTETVSLAAFASQPQVLFGFKNVTGTGNNIYVDNINIDMSTGINDVGISNTTVSLSPNPVNDVSILTVNTTTKNRDNFQLQVYNVLGEKIKTILPASKSALTFQIKKDDFSKGVYFYHLIENRRFHCAGKFVVD
ncbi:MAG: PKD domain-containing protein [Phycisphaerae bacterium]|nr:PKD domain-containing protein [Saprospiraceae bacterium]